MKALVFSAIKEPLKYRDIQLESFDDPHVVVDIKAAALNRRDYWITQGMYPGLRMPTVLGSDGCGMVDGKEVIINPNINWGKDQRFPGKDYYMLGLEEYGTLAEQVVVRRDRIVDKPSHLNIDEAAALPLGGLTAFRVLFTKCQLKKGEKVLISGVGGGVALFAFQFALAVGAELYVTSGSDEKLQKAVDMGALGGANYKEENWTKAFSNVGGFDVIIDSAGGPGFSNLVSVCGRGGRIGVYGGTRGRWHNISPQIVFFKQMSILGSTMGSDLEFHQMVDFVNTHKIVPVVDSVYAMSEGNEALDRMAKSEQFGKIVLNP